MHDDPAFMHSALLHPDQCCLLFVDFVGLPDGSNETRHQAHRAILELAAEFAVPLFVTLKRDADADMENALRTAVSESDVLRRAQINPWQDDRIRDRIFETDRARLVLAGGCAEGSLMQAALSALEDAYDVFVLFDLSDDKLAGECSPMAQRLIQAGAVPLTARQLLLEWTGAKNGNTDPSGDGDPR